jgi:rod shape determining protein RodA
MTLQRDATDPQTIRAKMRALNWPIVVCVVLIGGFGLLVLYSVGGGTLRPWALSQGLRFAFFLTAMLALSLVDLRFWMKIAYPSYAIVLLLLIGTEVLGAAAGGSQRWLDLGFVRLQPSEFMKLAVVLALARYYHFLPRVYATDVQRLAPPFAIIFVPAILVLMQPDLGTALLIIFGGVSLLFLAGVSRWLFLGGGAVAVAALPVFWTMLHDYQQRRILTLLNPESDPLGSGYHITQSKIAIGSGGLSGKGFLQGTQGHLQFLPEMHTDFIFPMLVEEWGLLGGLSLISLYAVILGWALWVSLTSRSQFGRLLAGGIGVSLFLYVAINLSMVMGLAPVVGVPLPLVSFGGSAMMTFLLSMGVLFSVSLNREATDLRV